MLPLATDCIHSVLDYMHLQHLCESLQDITAMLSAGSAVLGKAQQCQQALPSLINPCIMLGWW
jgi:hypothetical protein